MSCGSCHKGPASKPATDAVAALTGAAFGLPGIDRVEIYHDAANVASGRIPAQLGYARLGERPTRALWPPRPAKRAPTWSGRSLASVPVPPSPASVTGRRVVHGAVRPTRRALDWAVRPLPPISGRAHAGSIGRSNI
jgi:hypothetical protein